VDPAPLARQLRGDWERVVVLNGEIRFSPTARSIDVHCHLHGASCKSDRKLPPLDAQGPKGRPVGRHLRWLASGRMVGQTAAEHKAELPAAGQAHTHAERAALRASFVAQSASCPLSRALLQLERPPDLLDVRGEPMVSP
jgi:hypothetical protein